MKFLQLVAVASLLALTSSCREAVCATGKVEACACPNGSMGAQTCDASGSGFGACECASAPSCSGAGAPTCGTHGVCTASATAASCTCFPGYVGTSCSDCANGYQDNDHDGVCTPSCGSLTCTHGGTCSDTSGSATCVCPAAFTGTTCAECAAGFQDRDGDGTCEAACTATACGAHGTCTDVTGRTACVCSSGYSGMSCATCASGFQDANGDGTCEPTCATAMRGCGLGGTCTDSSGTPTCQCATGYAGASCAQCANDFQDNDGNNSCERACTANACSAHGTCDDQTGRVACTCTAGYAGADCSQCAPGFQDGDGDGTCLPACTATTCGTRERCVDTSGTATCQCVLGFTPGDAGLPGLDCRFTGGPLDPSFQGTPAAAWSSDAGWVFAPATAGVGDLGVVTLPVAFRGRTDATLSQSFTLAGSELREGLQLTVRARETNCGSGLCSFEKLPIQFSLNGVVTTLPFSNVTSRTFCVGPAALGPSTTLVLSGGPSYGVNGNNEWQLDAVTFQPSTNCPAPGELRNGNFESGPWASVGSGGSVTFGTGGATATTGGRLSTTTVCSGPTIATPLSIPTAANLSNPALRLTLASPTSSRVTLKLDNTVIATVSTTPTPAQYTVCVPDALRGAAGQLTVGLDFSFGGCGLADVRVVDVDDVALASDSSCAGGSIVNGNFERAPRDGFANVQSCANGPASCAPGTMIARHVLSAAEAHSGTGSYQLELGQRCATNKLNMTVTVPASNATGGPALRYFYRLPTLDSGGRATALVEGVSNTQLPISATFSPRILCLEPRMVGRPATLQFGLESSGICANTFTNDVFAIDDVDVYLDPTCPR